MNYNYVHIHAAELFSSSSDDQELILDSFPKDRLFQAKEFWCFYDFKEKIELKEQLKITFEIHNLVLGPNLIGSRPTAEIPKTVYKLIFNGIPGNDDFGTYQGKFLVVSDIGLNILRENGVVNAESDKITEQIDEYFSQMRHYFWMPESIRKKFIENFHKS